MGQVSESQIEGLTVRIDRERCIGSSACMRLAPEVFAFDDERICAFREDREAIAREALVEACAVCPVGALTAIAADGTRLAPRA
jgi:ferredoxin